MGSAFTFKNINDHEQEDTRIKHSFTAPETETLFVLRCYFAENPVRAVAATPGQPPPKPFITVDPKYVLDKYGSGRYKDEKGKEVVKMFQVHKDPEIFIVPCFIEDEEIQHLIGLAEKAWVPSTVGRGVYKTGNVEEDLKNTKSNNRTSYSCMLRSTETTMVAHVEHRLAALANLDVTYLERLNMVRYFPGQYFNEHHDGNFRPKTVFVYLNDLEDEEGGETMFTNIGVQIRPRKGCAVMWSNLGPDGKEDLRMIHRGVAPLTGVKYGVNCFFNDRPIRDLEAMAKEADAKHGTDR
jgi:prolyl 4-hydroxylase